MGENETQGRAAGEVEGRRMAVMREETGPEEGLGAIAAILGSIAMLGVPAKGAVTTTAVGSRL